MGVLRTISKTTKTDQVVTGVWFDCALSTFTYFDSPKQPVRAGDTAGSELTLVDISLLIMQLTARHLCSLRTVNRSCEQFTFRNKLTPAPCLVRTFCQSQTRFQEEQASEGNVRNFRKLHYYLLSLYRISKSYPSESLAIEQGFASHSNISVQNSTTVMESSQYVAKESSARTQSMAWNTYAAAEYRI